MYTFNIGFVMEQGPVIIIVCASQEPIDQVFVSMVATKYFQQACENALSVADTFNETVKGIKAECHCDAVIVSADKACFIPRKHQDPQQS